MYRVGEMWESNQISVATEHLATSITESLLNHIFQSVDSDRRVGKKVIIAGTEKENHQVGTQIVKERVDTLNETNYFNVKIETSDLSEGVPDSGTQVVITFHDMNTFLNRNNGIQSSNN